MVTFKCTNCNFQKEVDEKYLNKQVRCPVCKSANRVTGQQLQSAELPKDIIKFRCPECNQKIGVGSEYAGKRVRCAKCRNCLTVPGGAKPAVEPVRKPVEQQAEPVEEYKLLDSEESAEEGPAYVDASRIDVSKLKSVPRRRAPAKSGDGKKLLFLIGGGVCALVIVIIGVLVMSSLVGGSEEQVPQAEGRFDYLDAQVFAEDFIEMLREERFDEAKRVFVPELQNSVSEEQMNEMAGVIGKDALPVLDSKMRHFDEQAREGYFLLEYNLGDEYETKLLSVIVLDNGDELMIEGVSFWDDYGQDVSLVSSRCEELAGLMAVSMLASLGKMAAVFFIVFAILVLITIASMWIVFSKAGEPGWAAIVPVYNMWVLAEIGDKPGWMGLAAALAGGIPFIGTVIQLVLYLNIDIGVAKSFNKGIIFGLGLCFLPFVFFPILAFSRD